MWWSGWTLRCACLLAAGPLAMGACTGSTSSTPRQPLRHQGAFRPHDVVRAAVETGDGLVAVGLAADGAAAWSSPDGVEWKRMHLRRVPGASAESLATDGQTLVAAGAHGGRATTWVSPDGRQWRESLLRPSGSETSTASGVAARGGTLVVVGELGGGTGPTPVAWSSEDAGSTWIETILPMEGTGTIALVNEVTATAHGFVAVGAELEVDLPVHGVAWAWSERGWVRAATLGDPAGGDLELTGITLSRDGELVAAGTRYDDWDDPASGGSAVVVSDLLGTPELEAIGTEAGPAVVTAGADTEWLLLKQPAAGRSRLMSRRGAEGWVEVEAPALTTAFVATRDGAVAFARDGDDTPFPLALEAGP